MTATRNDAQACFSQVFVHRVGLFEVEEFVSVAVDDYDWALHLREHRPQVVSLERVTILFSYRLVEGPVQILSVRFSMMLRKFV